MMEGAAGAGQAPDRVAAPQVPALSSAPDRSSSWGPRRDAAGVGGAHDSAGWGPSGGGRYGFRSRARSGSLSCFCRKIL